MRHFPGAAVPLVLFAAGWLFCAAGHAAEPARKSADAPAARAGQKEAAPQWEGVDKTVIEKYAEAAGRPAREPYINTDQGDLLLFCFLVAGVIAGFIAGYYFRALFPPRPKKTEEKTNV